MNEHAAENIKLLDEVVFIDLRRKAHELQGYLEEIVRRGIKGRQSKEAKRSERARAAAEGQFGASEQQDTSIDVLLV